MADDSSPGHTLSLPAKLRHDQLCEEFEKRLLEGSAPRIEDVLSDVLPAERRALFAALMQVEVEYRPPAGADWEKYRARFPEFSAVIDALQHGSAAAPPTAAPLPERIGRYRIQRKLGEGGYGVVYLGHDDTELHREVAIKVPHAHRLKDAGDAEAYLAEARTLARLGHHANIVPVHDVGHDEQFPCYIVLGYVNGTDLAARLRTERVSFPESAAIVAAAADGLNHAHRLGLFHRDIKPGNILLDRAGNVLVTDFGLALREQDVGSGHRFVGTKAYMSPEQARGEAHRVDGRSDIFSLGIVLYELLTGSRPFRGATDEDLRQQILHVDARPPRQLDPAIPPELERICLKALARRAAERYSCAADLADDLRHFLQHAPAAPPREPVAPTPTPPAAPTLTPASATERPPLRVVPKGLRSFDAGDADFFLDLLAGPRDRDGLPESIRFWKSRIERPETDEQFRIGLIYGPSGCGKSSLVKAGLLPRLFGAIIAVYVEATARETEKRLLNSLRKSCPELPEELTLTESLALLRQSPRFRGGKRVLIVLDQFEQWLHVWEQGHSAELIDALRQCDGEGVRCLVLVRDDFWLAVSRFLRDLEVDLVPGSNIALVDLFDPDHAEKVLTAFGRAFGKLPDRARDMSRDQREFLRQAVAGLARDNKVICVQLALFAEMMKGRSWTPATLKEVGGAEGIGVAFLEDTFSSPSANPRHRLHQKAVRAVLKALLPDAGSDIKGHLRAEADLLAASGYASRPRDFDEVMRILDGEVRLITPADPEGHDADAPPAAYRPGQRYYQLTHDYLVQPLRDWLTRKQKETRQGRAELRLAERAAEWSARPEKRHLPSLVEWAGIRLFTRSRAGTAPQRQMMRRADRHYLLRGVVLLAGLLLAGWGIHAYTVRMEARELRNRLLSAEIAEIPALIEEMEPRRARVEPLLRDALAGEDPAGKNALRLSLGLARNDAQRREFVYQRLLDARPEDFVGIRQVLAPHRDEFRERLWQEFAGAGGRQRRFRAAGALVDYAPDDPRRADLAAFLVETLLAQGTLDLNYWKDALKPAAAELLPVLAQSLEEAKWKDSDRRALIDLYRGFAALVPDGLEPLSRRLTMPRPGEGSADVARRRATVAAALAALGPGDNVWGLLKHTPDPTLRSYFIERLSTSGVDPRRLKEQLDRPQEVSIRRALILAIGGLPADSLPEAIPELLRLYENDPDAGIHGATRWTLRQWKQDDRLVAIDARLAAQGIRPDRNWFVNSQGQTFSIITMPRRLVYFGMQNVPLPPHRFAIGTTEVTVGQLLRAIPATARLDPDAGDKPSLPAYRVDWRQAASYCNRLSELEGIRPELWCYTLKNRELTEADEHQGRSGYRLPTEAEWVFACQSGAETEWHFGVADQELTDQYARWLGNSYTDGVSHSFPVGELKPNDSGLFDMHGNVSEWCERLPAFDDTYPGQPVSSSAGGSYQNSFANLAISNRGSVPRYMTARYQGLRIVRTIPENLER